MSTTTLHGVLRRPLITEKGQAQREHERKYLFEVAATSNKIEIARAVEKLFNVKVDSVNTQWVRGKDKRRGRFVGKLPNWKKAVVTLREGHTIDLFEGT